MLPLRLTIEGLYSYQQRTAIDFTRLCDAQLFGIFGPVGSGKSTILDAICFALYENTERLGKTGDNRYYNMMNLRANALLIDFELQDAKGDRFRFVVKGRRNSKNYDQVYSFDRSVLKRVEGEWVPQQGLDGEILLNLTYNNFKRTVIIPQGQFQEFVKLPDQKRVEMLEQLFSLEKFNLQHQVGTLASRNNAHLQEKEGQLLELGEVTEEAQLALKQQVKELQEQLQHLEGKRKKEEEDLQALEALQKLHQKLTELRAERGKLRAREPEIQQQEQRLNHFLKCRELFKDLLEQADRQEQRVKVQKHDLQQVQERLRKNEEEQAALQPQWEQVQAQWEQREEARQELQQLQQMWKALELRQKVEQAQAQVARQEQKCDSARVKSKQLEQQVDELEQQALALKEQLPEVQPLYHLLDWFKDQHQQQELQQELSQELEALKGSSQELRAEKDKLLAAEEGLAPEMSVREAHEALAQQEQQREERTKALDHELHQLGVKRELGNFATSLAEGEPCPLCGAAHHPQPLQPESVDGELKQLRQEQELLRQTAKRQQNLLGHLREWKVKQQEVINQKHKLDERQQALQQEKATLRQRWKWDEEAFPDAAAVKQNLEEHDQLKARLVKLEKQVQDVRKSRKEVDEQLEPLERQLDQLRQQMGTQQGELKALRSQVEESLWQQWENQQPEALKQEVAERQKQQQQLEETYARLDKARNKLREEKSTLTATEAEQHKQLEQLQQEARHLEAQLQERLVKADLPHLQSVRELLQTEVDSEALKQEVEAFREQAKQCERDLKQIEQELDGQEFDPEAHQTRQQELQAVIQQEQAARQQLGGATGKLTDLKSKLERKHKLLKEQERLLTRKEDLQTLSRLFRKRGFVNYISSMYLQQICAQANKRFRVLSRQALALEVTENNELQVRDYLHNGRLRSVKTLSGGQTFQVSLCLALALADHVAALNEAEQNFFFLDEGFGTLDKEALQTVFETLQSLRQEKRIVGIISHVEHLQEELDVHLRIHKDEEKGSIVKPSWVLS